MNRFIYKKSPSRNVRKMIRLSGLVFSGVGLLLGMYMFFPLLSWELYIKPAFATQTFASPIPKKTIITKDYLSSLVQNTENTFKGLDYSNIQNWFPDSGTYQPSQVTAEVASYYISVPKLEIENAFVSTVDNDISKHLVQYAGTTLPPNKGNAAIFGHSTLPQLFDSTNYKTIFANAHTLVVGDKIIVSMNNTMYTYLINEIQIVEPENTSFLEQPTDDSYLTIITCTPPGTTWKRLIVKARLERI